MVDECASCAVGDELLFTCSYCEKRFCAEHQFPHHGCEGFGRAAEAAVPEADAEWLPASALGSESVEAWAVESAAHSTPSETSARTSPEVTETVTADSTTPTDRESSRLVTVSPPKPSSRAASLSAGTWRDGNGRPPGAGDGVVTVRPMDSHRIVGGAEASAAPRTVGDWISRQTYVTLLLKIGLVSLLVNSAFYGGMALTMYGLLPLSL